MADNPAPTNGPESGTESSTEPEVFTKDYVKTLREEAARYRTEKKDAVAEAETTTRAAVVSEYEPQLAEKDSAIAELTQTNTDQSIRLMKLEAVLASEVPTADVLTVADLVQGSDEESISESVKRVMSIYGKKNTPDRPVDPTQGGGGHIPLNTNKVLNALEGALGIAKS